MCPLGSPSMGCSLLSTAFTSLVIERGMACKNLMIDSTQHEGAKRIFQLCTFLWPISSQLKGQELTDGMLGPLLLGRKGMQLFCDASFTSSQAALDIRSTLWGGRTTNMNV